MAMTAPPRPGAAPWRRPDLGADQRPERDHHGIGQISVMLPRGLRRDQPAQLMHADAEMPFMLPAPRRIEALLVILLRQDATEFPSQSVPPRPWLEETTVKPRRPARRSGARDTATAAAR